MIAWSEDDKPKGGRMSFSRNISFGQVVPAEGEVSAYKKTTANFNGSIQRLGSMQGGLEIEPAPPPMPKVSNAPAPPSSTPKSPSPPQEEHAIELFNGSSKGNLSEQMGDMEVALSVALMEYRHKAEEILASYIETVEQADAAHQLELASIRAENGKLRDMAGVNNPTETHLFQNVALEAEAKPGAGSTKPGTGNAKKRMSHLMVSGASEKGSSPAMSRKVSPVDDKATAKGFLNANGVRDGQAPPGGSWQQFVAWVPQGSSLQAPEPWKPVPQTTLQASQQQSAALQATKKVKDDDSESEDSDESNRGNFEVLTCWHLSRRSLSKARRSREGEEGKSRCSGETTAQQETDGEFAGDFEEQKRLWFMIHPHAKKRISWDIASLVLVVYDMIMIPMSVFELPEDNLFLTGMTWTTRLFWTTDVIWSSVTGVVAKDGTVVFDMRYVLIRYVKTWFVLDMFIVGSDWFEVLMAAGGTNKMARLTKTVRIVRGVRLLRLLRMQEVVATISERIQSDKLAFIVSIAKLMIFVVAVSHAIACAWWGIGRPDSHSSWVGRSDYRDSNLESRYLVSLHWSLAMFSGGMDEITPVSASERLFAVAIWLFTFMAASIIVSVLTSNLTQSHIIGGAQSRQLSCLRKYLKQNAISSNLALRVQRSAQHALSGELTSDAVELLPLVSDPLRSAMHFEMYWPSMRTHPFFSEATNEVPNAMRRLTHSATSSLLLDTGDVVFVRGDAGDQPKMYFVSRGKLEYTWRGETVPVGEKTWAAEGNLWTAWRHMGTLRATTDVKLTVLDAKTFQQVFSRVKGEGLDPKLYAADFCACLNTAKTVNDLTSN